MANEWGNRGFEDPFLAFGSEALVLTDVIESIEENVDPQRGLPLYESIISRGTVVYGPFEFHSPVMIDGNVCGRVISTSSVMVGPQAVLEADLDVADLIVEGDVRGTVVAQQFVNIRPGGSLIGDIYCKTLHVEEGGSFEGRCQFLAPV